MKNLENLLINKKITQYECQVYETFMSNDAGRSLLKSSIESILMEEPIITPQAELFVWHDGRRSVWRDIKRCINFVENLLEGSDDDVK